MTYERRLHNLRGCPASTIAGDVRSWKEGHKHARQNAAVIGCEADAEITRLRAAIDAMTAERDRWKLQSDDWQSRGWELGKALDDALAKVKAMRENAEAEQYAARAKALKDAARSCEETAEVALAECCVIAEGKMIAQWFSDQAAAIRAMIEQEDKG